jgi:integrase/recombinase XerD
MLQSDDPWLRCRAAFLMECHARSSSWGTVKTYEAVLSMFFRECAHSPADVDREDILRFLRRPYQHGPNKGQLTSISNRNNRLSALASFFEYASSYTISGEDGPRPLFTRANPTARIKFGKSDRGYHALTEEELTRLFSVIGDDVVGKRDRALFLLCVLSARRIGEVALLRASDIQPATFTENGTRRQGLTFTFFGKGRHTIEDRQEMPQAAWEAIQEYERAAGRWPLAPTDFLFAPVQSSKGGCPVDPFAAVSYSAIMLRLKRYAKRAGLDERLSLHWFRHTSARLRLESGETLQQVQRALRHTNLATTDTYVRQLLTAEDQGAAKLEARFSFLSK